MSDAIAFDTHRFVNGNLATKADIAGLAAKVEAKIEASKVDLLKWMVMAMIAQGTLIVALVVTFIR